MKHCCCVISIATLLSPSSKEGPRDRNNRRRLGIVESGQRNNAPNRRQKKLLLILQCYSDGVVWRGLLPLLFSSNLIHTTLQSSKKSHVNNISSENDIDSSTSPSHFALYVLMNHFQTYLRLIEEVVDDNEDVETNNHDSNSEYADFAIHEHSMEICDNSLHCYTTTTYDMQNFQESDISCNNIPIHLILLTPFNTSQFCYSRTPSTRPTNTFALRLISYEKTFIQLTSLSAYISTLGGGYFLCRYLPTAVTLARRQYIISLLRGDYETALKCRINEGYCYIHGGKFNRGRKVIRQVLKIVIYMQNEHGVDNESCKEDGLLHHTPERELSELTVIKNMCYSALRFAKLVKQEAASSIEERGICLEDGGGKASHLKEHPGRKEKRISPTHDDFQRIRILPGTRWG